MRHFSRHMPAPRKDRIISWWVLLVLVMAIGVVLVALSPSAAVVFGVVLAFAVVEDLEMDPEHFEDLVVEFARRAGRSLEGAENNPWAAETGTIAGLVAFLQEQPREPVADAM